MTLILIDLPNLSGQDALDFFEHRLAEAEEIDNDATVEIDPSVYVVDYGSVENGPAVFVRREDAEAFDETFARGDHDVPPGVQRVTIADAETARLMIEQDDDADPERESYGAGASRARR